MRLSTRIRIQHSLSITILLALGVLFTTFQQHRSQQALTAPSAHSITSQAPSSHAINGFRFTSNKDGHRSIDIRADQFLLKKKKMGMFRLGLFNEAIFQNARIDLYGQRRDPLEKATGTADYPSGTLYIEAPGQGEGYAFSNAFSPENFESLQLKKIAAVHLAPIALRFFVEDHLKISVRADRAVMDASPREMRLTGNVIWQGGDTELQTDSLVVFLSDNIIRSPGAYRITRGAQVISGHKLEADFLLNRIRQEVVDFGSGQGRNDFETDGAAVLAKRRVDGLRRGFQKSENAGLPAEGGLVHRRHSPGQKMPFMDGH